MNGKNVIFEQVKCPADRSPIFLVNLTAKIRVGNSKRFDIVEVKNIVVKGTIDQIKKSYSVKQRFMRDYFKNDATGKKKVRSFNFEKLTITDVKIIRGLGYGIK